MLKLADLAQRVDFRLGPLSVSPSRRHVQGPTGEIHVEPLIMQAFLLLLHAKGRVVTRNELFEQCWGGAMVGDDSLNHAIAGVRRIAASTAPQLFEIETIPRTGYRLVGEILSYEQELESIEAEGPEPDNGVSRRLMVGSAIVAAVAASGAGVWLARPRSDPRFDALMERGENALRLDNPEAVKFFEQATAIEPRNARAWGLLAYTLGSGGHTSGPLAVPGPTAQASERAARTALRIDPNEPNALLAMTFVQIGMRDRIEGEKRLRQILAIDPDNTLVMQSLGQMLHSVGRCLESLALVERATAIEPLAPDFARRKAMSLWIVGRVPEADRVSDRAMQLWPSHRLVRMARLMIYAFTGRTQAALAMVEEEEKEPNLLSPSAAAVWRVSLAALEDRTSSSIAAARKLNLDGARQTPATSAHAILILSALGELDAAFEVANGFLLGRGSVIVRPKSETKVPLVNSPGWRNTFGLFSPPTKAMRLDPRFGPLAAGLGLTDYWRRRGIGPDSFLFNP